MDYQLARQKMVENQIRPNYVTDHGIISAMLEIPREEFVPEEVAAIAYVDKAIPIRDGRYLMAPMVWARLLQEARISADDLVLNIGCDWGYSAAVLARISKAVVAVEVIPELVEKASSLLVKCGIDNAIVVEEALTQGFSKQAPYDVIVLGGAVAHVPEVILNQLADGGRLVAVIKNGNTSSPSIGKAVVMKKIRNAISSMEMFEASVPNLPTFFEQKGFEF